MGRNRALSAIVTVLLLCAVRISTASAAPLSLTLPQANAFAILGRSCGGIHEKAYVTGFANGSCGPTGVVNIQTRCGGSGRGGGYKVTTYSAWVGVTWDFAGNVVSATKLTTVPTLNSRFSASDHYGDQIYNSNNAAYVIVPVPSNPTLVTAVQSGDIAVVTWTLGAKVNPVAVTSTTLTATPVGPSASIITTTVKGTFTSGLVGPLQPDTTYTITALSTTVGGSSGLSNPLTIRTVPASVAPSAPTVVKAGWATLDPVAATDTLIVNWNAAVPGDSPVDFYEVTITGSDGAGTLTQSVSGAILTASFTIDFVPNWDVTVRAHNAAGSSQFSARVTVGGL